MIEAERLSFELNEEMLKMIAEEYKLEDIAVSFKNAREESVDSAREALHSLGQQVAKRVLQLGEEYPDRTYEILKEAVDHTGAYKFPLVPQRFAEIAYLALLDLRFLMVVENNPKRFVFQIKNCRLRSLIGEGNLKPCRQFCIALVETIFGDLGLDVSVEIKEIQGCCEICAERGL